MDRCDPPAKLDIETNDTEHQLAVRGFVALWHRARPRLSDLGADPATVDVLQRQGRIVVDPDDFLLGIHGLSAPPTPHHIAHRHGLIHTWCAFDAIGIPAALGLDAQAATACPTCGRQLQVTFIEGQPTEEPDLRLWLPNSQYEHVLDDLCAHANLYCNDEHLTAGQARPTGNSLTIAEAAAIGRVTWQDAALAVSEDRLYRPH